MKNTPNDITVLKSSLIIAGSDSGAGAGIQADIKTFMAHNVYACNVITCITAQNTNGVIYKFALSKRAIKKQLEAIFQDFNIEYVKIGMLYNLKICHCVYKFLKSHPNLKVILDPVMVSKTKSVLLNIQAIKFLKHKLVPLVYLITPNIDEAKILANNDSIETISDVKKTAKILSDLGAKNVLIKGGHLPNTPLEAIDILFDGEKYYQITGKRWAIGFTHGTGCSLSSAITANLSNGLNLVKAVREAKKYVNAGIATGKKYGHGINSINHNIKLKSYEHKNN